MVRGFHFHPYLYGSEIPDIYSVYTQDTASQRKCTYIQKLSRRTWTILGFLFQCRYYTWGCSTCVSRGRLSFPFQWSYIHARTGISFSRGRFFIYYFFSVYNRWRWNYSIYILLGFDSNCCLSETGSELYTEIVVSFCFVLSFLRHTHSGMNLQ